MTARRRREKMISPVSSAANSSSVQQYPAVKLVPSTSNPATSNEDTVQLSAATQQHLESAKRSAEPAERNFTQIIKEAADGDIAALAQLALIA
jgi:hypothetical protein